MLMLNHRLPVYPSTQNSNAPDFCFKWIFLRLRSDVAIVAAIVTGLVAADLSILPLTLLHEGLQSRVIAAVHRRRRHLDYQIPAGGPDSFPCPLNSFPRQEINT